MKCAVFERNISFVGKYSGSIASISDQIAYGLSMISLYQYGKTGRFLYQGLGAGRNEYEGLY